MPATNKELLDEPKALIAAGEAGVSDNSPSCADSDCLDLDNFDFSPFIRDTQEPADVLGRLTTAEELFSYILRPLTPAPLLIPHGSAAADDTPARAVADAISGQAFAAQKRDVSERVDGWFTEFEQMCIRSKRMEDELEPLVALASERVEQATGGMLSCIEQCEQARDAALGEQGRLARARSMAGEALNGCVEDLLDLRGRLELVRTAARTFPTAARGPVVLFATTKAHLKRYFDAVDVPLPAALTAQERADDH